MHNHNEDHHHPHAHSHEHDHSHTHDHGDGHTHSHDEGSHHHGSHENLLASKTEAAAFLQYTLHHNAHHDEELSDLAHSLEHLQLGKEAEAVRQCIDELAHANRHLESVLKMLQDQQEV